MYSAASQLSGNSFEVNVLNGAKEVGSQSCEKVGTACSYFSQTIKCRLLFRTIFPEGTSEAISQTICYAA